MNSRVGGIPSLVAVAMVIFAVGVEAAPKSATTFAGKAGGKDGWNTAANWDKGVPTGEMDVIINGGASVGAMKASTPAYSGNLMLIAKATLTVHDAAGSEKAVTSAERITLHHGSKI